MKFPTLISWTSPFPFYGLFGGIFHFYLNFNRTFFKQTVDTLVRRHIMWRLNWVCTACLCPTKRRLGLYGLIILSILMCHTVKIIFQEPKINHGKRAISVSAIEFLLNIKNTLHTSFIFLINDILDYGEKNYYIAGVPHFCCHGNTVNVLI